MGNKVIKNIIYISIVILGIILIGLNYLIYKNQMLAFHHANVIVSVVSVILVVLLWFINAKSKNNFGLLLIIIGITGMAGLGLYKMHNVVTTFEKMQNDGQKSVNVVKVIVLKSSSYYKISDLKDKKVQALNSDRQDINKVLTGKNKLTLQYQKGQVDLYHKLDHKDAAGIVLTSKSQALLKDTPVKDNKYRVIFKADVVDHVKKVLKTVNSPKFNVYISGLDTYGPISTVSRSDVNILMTTNLQTGKILLTSTPRDAYVKIADGGQNQYDKLTHAGIYGVQASMHTLENLYQQKINYFVKFNFESFTKLIALVGGVDVYNNQEFVSLHSKIHFKKGNIHLTSESALPFVRERYALENGDRDRAQNQEKVIRALIEKLSQSDNLLKADQIFAQISPYIQTNISLKQAMKWINYQIENHPKLQVETTALQGTGTMNLPSYAMPNSRLYMVQVNEKSLHEIQKEMNEILDNN
ncbi:LCP family protein [Ligilactobacillus ceti]|uniref:Cell envelope-related transcriptional attenuator domain-containing protein n=1 Tax=Ligilactobacillus ceti DSM 22408 TaxID=1122146 RepID=A0A0R2KPQ0_9LACO|nr:LCP family protein [Ligilactobacillus ceti]KRN88391.1 hypothetical protein IV53_GL000355 [Ligilactobacillus ceti DSM 22408]